jgi:thiol-disulfide isomerase/thioredoxin
MKEIKVLGSGCAKCTKTAELISHIAGEYGREVSVVKETSPQALLEYDVMKTPAVVMDDELVHSVSIPDRKSVTQWLAG